MKDSDINTIPEENLSLLRYFDKNFEDSVPELVPEKESSECEESSSENTMLDVMGINSMDDPLTLTNACIPQPPWVPVELTQHFSS